MTEISYNKKNYSPLQISGTPWEPRKNPSNPKIPLKQSYYFSNLVILFQKYIPLIRKSH